MTLMIPVYYAYWAGGAGFLVGALGFFFITREKKVGDVKK